MTKTKAVLIIFLSILISGSLLGCTKNSSGVETDIQEEKNNEDTIAEETAKAQKEEQEKQQEYYNQYAGDWYGKVSRDGGEIGFHVHIDGVEMDEEYEENQLLGAVYQSPEYYHAPDFFTPVDINWYWDSAEQSFVSRDDQSFVLSKSDTDRATFKAWEYGDMPSVGDNPYTIEMTRMSAEEIEGIKTEMQDEFNKKFGQSEEESSTMPSYIIGEWTGVTHTSAYGDMGFRFTFEHLSGMEAEGTVTVTQEVNIDGVPNFGYGVDHNFTAMYYPEENKLIVDWSDGKFNFSLNGETMAIYHSQYGDIPLSKN